MQRLCNFSMHALFFLACGSSCPKLPRVRAKDHVCLCSNHSTTFSTIEVILPMQRQRTALGSTLRPHRVVIVEATTGARQGRRGGSKRKAA